jgi:hypothetical protein
MMRGKGFLLTVRFFALIALLFLVASPAMSYDFSVGGKQLSVLGYFMQQAQFSLLQGDHYDTEQDLQGALFNAFLEANYNFRDDMKFYVSGMLTYDWVYDLKSSDSSWNDKLFAKSRRELYSDNNDWQILKEAHVTWSPERGMLRVGKQMVAWGEFVGTRIMDQWNPQDQRRGFADVQFETSLIPIWLVRGEYHPVCKPNFLQDLGIELVFNPNVEFIPNVPLATGGNVGGIWAPNVTATVPRIPPIGWPGGEVHVGSSVNDINHTPRSLSSEGFEYGVRLRGIIADDVWTFNYFYGLDNSALSRPVHPLPTITPGSDGMSILHPTSESFYPLLRFLGITYLGDFPSLRAASLGGVAPTLTVESLYAFSDTFVNASSNQWERHDELRLGVQVDWKVKIPALNRASFFSISPNWYMRHIFDYPKVGLNQVFENNYTSSLVLMTSYFHNKIAPQYVIIRDWTNQGTMHRMTLTYDRSSEWHFTLGAVVLNGQKQGAGFDLFDHKNFIYFKTMYKWG